MGYRKFLLRTDMSDPRDKIYTPPADVLDRPLHVNLNTLCGPLFNQLSLGSCTGNAWSSMMFFIYRRKDPSWTDPFSRLFLYFGGREELGTIYEDSGAMIRDGAKWMAKYGVCPESMWPYDIKRFRDRPTIDCYKAAGNLRITEYFRITSLDGMIACLAEGYPIVFGMMLYDSFNEAGKTGVARLPKKGEQLLGGHALLIVGYDLERQVFIVRNSWGHWGKNGTFEVPFTYLATPGLADDFWTVRK